MLYEDLVKVAKAAGIPHVKAWEVNDAFKKTIRSLTSYALGAN